MLSFRAVLPIQFPQSSHGLQPAALFGGPGNDLPFRTTSFVPRRSQHRWVGSTYSTGFVETHHHHSRNAPTLRCSESRATASRLDLLRCRLTLPELLSLRVRYGTATFQMLAVASLRCAFHTQLYKMENILSLSSKHLKVQFHVPSK